MTSARDPAARQAELAANLRHVQERIGAACRAAGRPSGDVALIVVTKFFPAADIETLFRLGVTDIGENRDQEASAKVAALPPEVRQGLQVHFIGQLQSNKAPSLASYADTVHSIDRDKLVRALDRAATAAGRELGALIQVSLDGDPAGHGRGGILPDGVAALADSIAAAQHLALRGVMAVAPLGADPAEAFGQLAAVSGRVRADHPGATWISAGMSADLEAAVANGATHLRVGSAILGSRPPFG
ncbi:MAG TPA: YggS family pyridoxal phosphate-dependent enzyme [Dermatophilaceae bacterium]|nr:YggS family pyridoxal phosphate-dependent enzyme [Dermatophilaceae bacterium]